MFRCERCGTEFGNKDAKGLTTCPICREDGVKAPLTFTLFAIDGRSPATFDRWRRAARKLPADSGRSPDVSEDRGASP
jgi:hypothetical protein